MPSARDRIGITRIYAVDRRDHCSSVLERFFLITAFVVIQGWMEISPDTGKEWLVTSSKESEHYDALLRAKDAEDGCFLIDADSSSGDVVNRTESAGLMGTYVSYESPGNQGSVLNAPLIKLMCEYERIFLNVSTYKEFCMESGPAAGSPCAPQTLSFPRFSTV